MTLPTITISGPDELPDAFIDALADLLLSIPDESPATAAPTATGDTPTGKEP